MQKATALLVSAPWANYQSPSLPICHLAAYAKEKGFDVDVKHLYLETAASIGLPAYDTIVESGILGEQIGASLIFPRKSAIAQTSLNIPKERFSRLAQKSRVVLESCCRKTLWDRYDLVAFSVNYQQLFPSIFIATWIKKRFPRIRILFGGRLVASSMGESVLRAFPQIDWCIDGEGEIPLAALLGKINGRTDFEKTIPGLIYRTGKTVTRNPRTRLPRLSTLCEPDYTAYFSLLQTHRGLKHENVLPHIAILEGTGCNYQCVFCCDKTFWGPNRQVPSEEIATKLHSAVSKYGIVSFILVSQMIDPTRCRTLFRRIASLNMDLCLICETRAAISKEDLRAMKLAGVTELQIGFEALDTRLLEKMHKGNRLIDNLRIMKWCQELGLATTGNLMLRFPTESQRDIDRTTSAIDFACSFMPPSRFVDFQLRQGCAIERNPGAYGISSIRNSRQLTRFLPKSIADSLDLWHKDFVARRGACHYRKLTRRYHRWRKEYFEAQSLGRPLLFFFDCPPALSIEDSRTGCTSVLLRSWSRDLYLFCDEIRSFAEIRKRFPKVPERELRKVLRQLFKLKVMYTEDDDWLSLAIHASPENRRHMPFL